MSTRPRDLSPEVLPEPDLVRHGPLVASGSDEDGVLVVWHWCTRSVWAAQPGSIAEYCRWVDA